MDLPERSELLDRVRALPAGGLLMQRLGDRGGVHLVGGAVRDLLIGRSPSELDLVVEDDPTTLLSQLGGEATRYERFGTSTVRLGGFSYDIGRARRETYREPGALPEVTPGTLEEDLGRRDFAVNAIALALSGPDAGTINTAPGAIDDLNQRVLRVLHDQSFVDDPTRLLRLARYHGRLGFAVEKHTAQLVARALAQNALQTVSGSRIGAELRLLAQEQDPLAAFRALRELGLDRAIDPRLGVDDEELVRRALALLPPDGRRDRLVLGVAARGVPQAELRELLDRLAFEADDREAIMAMASGGEQVGRALATAAGPSEIASAVQGLPLELVALAGALGPAEPARSWLEGLRHIRLEIDGSDLLRSGVAEGPAIGVGLRAALAAKLDGRTAGRGDELAAALQAVRTTG